MANQYSGSFEDIIQKKFNCTAEEALLKCYQDGLSYVEAEQRLGFKHGTIRKWANRFGIKLKAGQRQSSKREQVVQFFKDRKINRYNILSRRWLVTSAASCS